MRSSSSLPDTRRCPLCHAPLRPGSPFCSNCGARLEETNAERLRGVNYLLAELEGWERAGLLSAEQAATLRGRYEQEREALLAHLSPRSEREINPETASSPPAAPSTPPRADDSYASAHLDAGAWAHAAQEGHAGGAQPFAPRAKREPLPQRSPSPPEEEPASRTLLETLSDPHNLRLLLYTGAAMIVVSVVLWLRDVLYLKLQEPVVQAGLLAFATLAFTASGWYAILRTRQRLTGRALTLTGSLLVPINFWFLVRSGLIENNGRAWVVCAFCAILYAHTAALLRERLYVYLAACAAIATGWALVFRLDREAYGLYALSCMLASLLFLHISRLFPLTNGGGAPTTPEDERETSGDERSRGGDGALRGAAGARSGVSGPGFQAGRWSYELWSAPLVRVALIGASLSALLYMPLRVGPSLSLYDGLFQLHTNRYDASTAILLFVAWAYAVWFAGRFVYTDQRAAAYLLSVLLLCWTEVLALDGLRLAASTKALALSFTAFALALAHRLTAEDEGARALHRACIILTPLVLLFAGQVALNAEALTMTHSASLALLAAALAVLSGPRFNMKREQAVLSYGAVLVASAAFLMTLQSAGLRAETIFASCAAWPFALYWSAQMMRLRRRETQLVAPFALVADAELALLLSCSCVLAIFLHLGSDELLRVSSWRAPVFCVLLAASLYGALRAWREGSGFGAGVVSLSVLVLVATFVDTLKQSGVLPGALPVAAFVICAAYMLPKASALWLSSEGGAAGAGGVAVSPETTVRGVADAAVMICALVWFAQLADESVGQRFGVVGVLLLASLYWCERMARGRAAWMADVTFVNVSVFVFALLMALRLDTRWIPLAFALAVPPLFFAVGQYAGRRGLDWLKAHARGAAWVAAALAFAVTLSEGSAHLRAGDPVLLAPCLTTGALALMAFTANILIKGPERLSYFRAGLFAAVISFALACLRAGYDPAREMEIYTSPVAVMLLILAYLSVRREWEDYERDTNALLWMGSLLLAAPLLFHALEYRLILYVPAPWRDVGLLCAALGLVLFGVMGRLRAPVLIGIVALLTELSVLTVTSVQWTQVPLKVYLGSVGSLLMIAGWMLGFRREQLINMRDRFNEHREQVQERFGQWR